MHPYSRASIASALNSRTLSLHGALRRGDSGAASSGKQPRGMSAGGRSRVLREPINDEAPS